MTVDPPTTPSTARAPSAPPAHLVRLEPLDPFDLPEWLGTGAVTWRADQPVRDGHLVRGRFCRNGIADFADDADLACDLMAVDEAHPLAVADDEARRAAHLAWRHGQVHFVRREGRVTLACPGTSFTADGVLDAMERTARAVGADARRWEVQLLLGGGGRHH